MRHLFLDAAYGAGMNTIRLARPFDVYRRR